MLYKNNLYTIFSSPNNNNSNIFFKTTNHFAILDNSFNSILAFQLLNFDLNRS